MRRIACLLFLLLIALPASAATVIVDLTTAVPGKVPAEFTTTSAVDDIEIRAGANKRGVTFLNSTNDWYWRDPDTGKQVKILKDQPVKLPISGTFRFKATRVSADGTVQIFITE